jgi:MarR family transcriptional regulator, organic hydroperoxide resistance regulator
MSISREGRRAPRTAARRTVTLSPLHGPGAESVLPPTVSRVALLDNGSDRRFRQLVYDLFTIALRMEMVRDHHAARMDVTAAQYGVMMAIAQFQGRSGVAVGALAKTLHVSSAFIASETGKLARLGLVTKRPNPSDGRGVLLSLTRAGRQRIARVGADIRALNDIFFAEIDRDAFEALTAAAAGLVQGSRKAVQWLRLMADDPAAVREAAE